MKKILSFLAAGALALGLIGCSGDLHDKEISPLYIEGTCWTTREALEIVDDTTQKISFTYTGQTGWEALANEVHFKVITTPSGWNDDFGGSDTEDLSLVVNGGYVETHSRKNEGLPDTKHIVLSGLDMDTEYTIYIQYVAASNKVSIKYEGPDPIPTVDISAVAGSTFNKFKMSEKNKSYSLEVTGKGKDYEFTLFNGKDSYGLTATKDILGEKDVAFVKDGKVAKFKADDKKKYLISVNLSEEGDITATVVPALYNFKYGLSYLCSNYGNYDLTWVADGNNQKAVVTIPAGTKNAWGAENTADLEFGVTDTTSWGTKFTGAVLGLNNAFDLELGADKNNFACVNPSKEDITVTLIASEKGVTAAVTQASVDANALCFTEPLAAFNSNYGNYTLLWKPTGNAGEYKAEVKIPAGTKNGWGAADTADLEFGICNDGSWGVKYTGGVLLTKDTAVALTKDAEANNKASINPSAADVVITVVATKDTVKASF